MLRVKAAPATKRLMTENADGSIGRDSHGKVSAELKSRKRRLFTSDDVDPSQAVECAHQLSVGFFALHSTFLLQRLEELLHCHGAVCAEGNKKSNLRHTNTPAITLSSTDATHG